MQDNSKILGKVVRQARIDRGLSQEKLAEALGMDARTILGIESGRGNPKYDTIYALINFLDIPSDSIFHPDIMVENPLLNSLLIELHDCTEEEVKVIRPAIRYLREIVRNANMKTEQ